MPPVRACFSSRTRTPPCVLWFISRREFVRVVTFPQAIRTVLFMARRDTVDPAIFRSPSPLSRRAHRKPRRNEERPILREKLSRGHVTQPSFPRYVIAVESAVDGTCTLTETRYIDIHEPPALFTFQLATSSKILSAAGIVKFHEIRHVSLITERRN